MEETSVTELKSFLWILKKFCRAASIQETCSFWIDWEKRGYIKPCFLMSSSGCTFRLFQDKSGHIRARHRIARSNSEIFSSKMHKVVGLGCLVPRIILLNKSQQAYDTTSHWIQKAKERPLPSAEFRVLMIYTLQRPQRFKLYSRHDRSGSNRARLRLALSDFYLEFVYCHDIKQYVGIALPPLPNIWGSNRSLYNDIPVQTTIKLEYEAQRQAHKPLSTDTFSLEGLNRNDSSNRQLSYSSPPRRSTTLQRFENRLPDIKNWPCDNLREWFVQWKEISIHFLRIVLSTHSTEMVRLFGMHVSTLRFEKSYLILPSHSQSLSHHPILVEPSKLRRIYDIRGHYFFFPKKTSY